MTRETVPSNKSIVAPAGPYRVAGVMTLQAIVGARVQAMAGSLVM